MSAANLVDAVLAHPPMASLWSDENLVRTWLRTEVALAEVLHAEGLVPNEALLAIQASAQLENLDLDELRRGTRIVGMPIKPLVDQVVAAGGPLVGSYFHRGATTQDVLDTAQALRISASIALLQPQLRELLARLMDMADVHRATPMVARTNSQDASVTSWGLHVASYAAELARHLERLAGLTPRACTVMLGGAVGTLSAWPGRGLQIRRQLAQRLGLSEPAGAWNGSQDNIVELVQWTGLVLGSLVRMANDFELMGRAALGELRRQTREGASSTMPHKTNPRDANTIQTLFQLGTMYVGQAAHLMAQVDVRSAAQRAAAWTVVPGALGAASAALARANAMVEAVVVDPERMRANFAHSRGHVMSEAVMFVVAEAVGKDEAYRRVREALDQAPSDLDIEAALLASAELVGTVDAETLSRACDPTHYLGESDALINEALEAARAALEQPWPSLDDHDFER
ncbi:MAG: lyase family protein [Myxococcota bacterium]